MSETKENMTQFKRVVYNTEEMLQLWSAADRAGAEITGIDTLKDGAGIRVTLKTNGQQQF